MKLLAFDLDGTALNEDKKLTERAKSALACAYGKGILLVPSTGRNRSFIPKDVLTVKKIRYTITSNGAVVYDEQDQKEIYKSCLSQSSIRTALSILPIMDIHIEFYIGGKAFITQRDQEMAKERFQIPEQHQYFLAKPYLVKPDMESILAAEPDIEKINLPYLQADQRCRLWRALEKAGLYDVTASTPRNLEINKKGTSKGAALRALAEYLPIPMQEVMAIGDNSNDIEMLHTAGLSVAMGNATQEAMKAAEYQTDSCDDDGFAKAVERFLL